MPKPLQILFSGARPMRVAVAAAVLATLAVIASLYVAPQLAPRALAQVAGQMDRIAEALDRRSPGERQVGELSKGPKSSKSNVPGLPLQQRALGKVFPPEVDGLTLPLFPEPEFTDPGSLVTSPFVLLSIPPAIGGPGGGGGFSPPGGGAIILPPPGGGTGVIAPPGGGGPIVTPPTDVPAVPEPSTWAMLLIGFGFCAAILRRRRRPMPAGAPLRCITA